MADQERTMNLTDPSTLPPDVRSKLLRLRMALLNSDLAQAYHELYAIADPTFTLPEPWAGLSHGIQPTDDAATFNDCEALVARRNTLGRRPDRHDARQIGRLYCMCVRDCSDAVAPGLAPLYRVVQVINADGGVTDYLGGRFTLPELRSKLLGRIEAIQST